MLKRLALGFCLGSVLVIGTAGAQAPKPSHGGTPEEQKACAHDVARHCKAVMNADDLTVLGCLKQNRSQLAPACSKVLSSHGQ